MGRIGIASLLFKGSLGWRQVAAPTGAELFMGDPLRSVLCAVSLCCCFHGSLHNLIMVNCKEIYRVVKYRTELGEGGICACTHPSAPSGHLENGAISTGARIRKSLRYPWKGDFWRAAGCRPYGCGAFYGGSFAERVMRSIVVWLFSRRFT